MIRYFFIVWDFHPLLLAGLPAHHKIHDRLGATPDTFYFGHLPALQKAA